MGSQPRLIYVLEQGIMVTVTVMAMVVLCRLTAMLILTVMATARVTISVSAVRGAQPAVRVQ